MPAPSSSPGDTAMKMELAFTITPSDELVIDLSKLDKATLKDLEDANVFHVSHTKGGAFYGDFDPKRKTIRLNAKTLKERSSPRLFPGFTEGVHVVAIGKLSETAFEAPVVCLVAAKPK